MCIYELYCILGDSRKYPYLYHGRLFGFQKGRGVHDYGILRAWGGIYVWNPKAWGDSIGGISGEESVQ